MKISVDLPIPHEETEFASMINSLAEWLESDMLIPDHWDTRKKREFYKKVRKELSLNSQTMIRKLSNYPLKQFKN